MASSAALNVDCSFGAAMFAFIYVFINAILWISSFVVIYRFVKDYRKNVKKPPKILFYPGLFFFISSNIMLLVTLRNSMFICFHGDINYMDWTEWVVFITFYGLQTYQLWLVLFLRLKYVFKESAYKLSKYTVRIHITIFLIIPFASPLYLFILWLVSGIWYTIILLI